MNEYVRLLVFFFQLYLLLIKKTILDCTGTNYIVIYNYNYYKLGIFQKHSRDDGLTLISIRSIESANNNNNNNYESASTTAPTLSVSLLFGLIHAFRFYSMAPINQTNPFIN